MRILSIICTLILLSCSNEVAKLYLDDVQEYEYNDEANQVTDADNVLFDVITVSDIYLYDENIQDIKTDPDFTIDEDFSVDEDNEIIDNNADEDLFLHDSLIIDDDTIVDEDIEIPDTYADSDNIMVDMFEDVSVFPDDDFELPDESVEDECATDNDCPYGFACDNDQQPALCVYMSTCENDTDCTAIQHCVDQGHWKSCELNTQPDQCSDDSDCNKGEICEEAFLGFKVCRSLNTCDNNEQCPEGYDCEFNGTFYECIYNPPCETDSDCGYGFRCIESDPENYCEYMNECVTDEDCGDLRSCVKGDNWTECRLTGGGFCRKDSDCESDEYCDLTFGFAGICKSRNQCYQDEDCGEDYYCYFNGVYNECVLKDPKECLFDFQCEGDWVCLDYKCQPKYAGKCPEIEGVWTVWVSTSLLFRQGNDYEFIPEDGCDGSIKTESIFFTGEFTQTEPKKYDLRINYFTQCQATINLNYILSIVCGNSTAQLGRQ